MPHLIDRFGASVHHAAAMGALLRMAKEQIRHGEWAGWLKKNAPFISDRSARTWMQIARLKQANRLPVADLGIRAAVRSNASARPNGRSRQDPAAGKSQTRRARRARMRQTVEELKRALRSSNFLSEDEHYDLLDCVWRTAFPGVQKRFLDARMKPEPLAGMPPERRDDADADADARKMRH